MALSQRRKQVLIRESRDIVFRACSAGGGLLGLSYAVHHWNTKAAECHGGTEVLSRCVSHAVGAGVIAFLIPVFIGVIAGALVGGAAVQQDPVTQPQAACRRRSWRARRRPPPWSSRTAKGVGEATGWRHATPGAVTAAGPRSRREIGSTIRRVAMCASAVARRDRVSSCCAPAETPPLHGKRLLRPQRSGVRRNSRLDVSVTGPVRAEG